MKIKETKRKVKDKWRKVYIADYRYDGDRPRPWFTTKYEAERELTRIKELRFKERLQPGKTSSNIDVWLEKYLEILRNEQKSDGTIDRYRKIMCKFLNWIKDNYKKTDFLDDVEPDILDDYLSHLRTTPSEKTKKVNANTTIYLTFKVIKQFFNTAHRRGKMSENTLTVVKMKKPKSKRNRALSLEEVQAIYYDARGFIRDIAIFNIYTGLRQKELSLLKKTDDIDLDERILHIRGKGDKYRIVPIHTEALKIIKKYYKNSNTYLFEAATKEPFKGSALYKRLMRLYRLLSIKDANFHSLRHTFASEVDYRGKDRLITELLMGHESEQYVTGRYLHANLERMRMAIDSIDFLRK
ncbi:MAG: tyrosine-type recombinase/integrase [Candidatus Omnitrophica bacterium]|nr:tyrosine-type recombinase/integrase [Candidatus Omnitrophota bacterium]